MPTPYSTLLARAATSPGVTMLDVPEDWLQGRTVFGGLQAAIALAAMRTLVPDTPLRTLQGTFVAPVPSGTVTARAEVLRAGKSAVHVEARIVDGPSTLALFVGVFGAPRASAVQVAPEARAFATEDPFVLPFIPGVTPSFTQHFAARWVHGRPFINDKSVAHVLEIDMHDEGRSTEAHVLAIADLIPPIALSHVPPPVPASTLTWMMELLTEHVNDLPLTGWRVDAELVAARDGYTSQSVMVWGPGGVPVALSRQSMLVFEPR